MSLTAAEIEAVVAELAPLAGARVEGVRAHGERAVTLDVFGPTGRARLLLSAEPDVTRIHAARARPPRAAPGSAFQAVLRRELDDVRLVAIEAVPGDRVVVLRLEGPRGALRLVAELTGRHGNLFLVGPDGTVRASAGRSVSQQRRIVPGAPYLAPAAGPREEPTSRRLRFVPTPGERFPLSASIEDAYAAREEERLLAEGRRRLREPVRAALARTGRALERLAEEAARVPAAEADRRLGDLLKQNLSRVRRGAREVVLTEWTEAGAREVKVPLDPARSPQANMERYYRQHRRIVDSAARVASRAAEVRARGEALRALLEEIDRAALPTLQKLEREARRLGAGPRPAPTPRRRKEEPASPYRTFRSAGRDRRARREGAPRRTTRSRCEWRAATICGSTRAACRARTSSCGSRRGAPPTRRRSSTPRTSRFTSPTRVVRRR